MPLEQTDSASSMRGQIQRVCLAFPGCDAARREWVDSTILVGAQAVLLAAGWVGSSHPGGGEGGRVAGQGRKRVWRCGCRGSWVLPAVAWQGIKEPLENYCCAVPGSSSESAKSLLLVWSSYLNYIAVTYVSLLEGRADGWSPTAEKCPAFSGSYLFLWLPEPTLLASLFWEKLQISWQIFRLSYSDLSVWGYLVGPPPG